MRLTQIVWIVVALATQYVMTLAVPQPGSLTLPVPVQRNDTSQQSVRNGANVTASGTLTASQWTIANMTVFVEARIQLDKPIFKPDADEILKLAIKEVSNEDSAEYVKAPYICRQLNYNAIFEYRPDGPDQDLTWGEVGLLILSIKKFFEKLEPRVPIVNTYVMTSLDIWSAGGWRLGHALVSALSFSTANGTTSAIKMV